MEIMKRLLLTTVALGLFACGSEPATTSSEGPLPIPAAFGKSDNYIGTSAREYELRGTTTAALGEGFAELVDEARQEALDSAVARRTSEVTRAAQRHVEDLVRAANKKRLEENPLPEPDPDDPEAEEPEDPYQDYFIYVKSSNRGGKSSNVEVDGTSASFGFELEIAASAELIELLGGDDAAFELEIGAADAEPEKIRVEVEPSPSTDAFPRYDQMFADGVYDIAIVFGGDYNEERYDLETAKWTVQFLIEQGWTNPEVKEFADLEHDSPPFTRALRVEQRDIEARVFIVHAQMDDDADAEQSLLRDLTAEHMKSRDVVIYSGHAGSNAGMILDYHPRFELDDGEFKDLQTREDYQIYVFDGCNSYRTYVDALMENPTRTFENTDIVTTVNTTPFSAGYEIINRFVHWLTFSLDDGGHIPVSWTTLLRGVNDTYLDVHYGVHGIDQDPKLNPHGGQDAMCAACETNADCGAGANFCLSYEGGGACAVACTDSSACGEGYDCISIFDDPDLFYMPKQCVRSSLTCGG